MADINALATQFAEFYYSTFSTNRDQLIRLYRDTSMLSWEGDQFLGKDLIIKKLTGDQLQNVRHRITTLDAQPLPVEGGLCILITGELLAGDGEHPMKFSQVFGLLSEGGSYFIFNDVFRLNYG